MQQGSDSWRAEAKDFEHRVEELMAKQSASATSTDDPSTEFDLPIAVPSQNIYR
eukprot:gene28551-37509_t